MKMCSTPCHGVHLRSFTSCFFHSDPRVYKNLVSNGTLARFTQMKNDEVLSTRKKKGQIMDYTHNITAEHCN